MMSLLFLLFLVVMIFALSNREKLSFVVLVSMNVVIAFAECGPLQCPDNPTSSWLFD